MLYLDPPEGVARDKVQAYRWILHEKGVWPECEKRLAKLMSEMTSAERARAEADPGVEPMPAG
jgi:antirestriction protein ArdC